MIRIIKLFVAVLPLLLVLTGCSSDSSSPADTVDYRQEMRDFIMGISAYAKNINNNFIVIPQNGQELITDTGEAGGVLQSTYVHSFDATGRENLFYGYNQDDQKTPAEDKNHLLALCLLCEQNNVEVLTTDYCSTHSKMDDSFLENEQNGFISFAADHRELNDIPDYPATPYHVNNDDIGSISGAKNFLYLINGDNFSTKQDFISAVSATNYDAVIMDLYHNNKIYTHSEIEQLKTKQNGGKRLVIFYLSIGEAEDYRYYWQSDWKVGNPEFLEKEDPNWSGNYYVKYWDNDWQNVIYGNDASYLKKVVDTGFNGVYLDLIDAFEYFEED